jgi:formylglycine-generating enzyme
MKKIMFAVMACVMTMGSVFCKERELKIEMIEIPGKDFKMLETEVTQKMFESVMGENPSHFKGADLPVESVSWYDAIYFCNKLSLLKNLEPVYSVNGSTNVSTWDYTPFKFETLNGEITQNTLATGYRLPTYEEWTYAASGGEDYDFAGSDDLDEVGWHKSNSNGETSPVTQKQYNGYGLFDMSGNVSEWVWNSYSTDYRYYCGGCYEFADNCKIGHKYRYYAKLRSSHIGFRIVCATSEQE